MKYILFSLFLFISIYGFSGVSRIRNHDTYLTPTFYFPFNAEYGLSMKVGNDTGTVFGTGTPNTPTDEIGYYAEGNESTLTAGRGYQHNSQSFYEVSSDWTISFFMRDNNEPDLGNLVISFYDSVKGNVAYPCVYESNLIRWNPTIGINPEVYFYSTVMDDSDTTDDWFMFTWVYVSSEQKIYLYMDGEFVHLFEFGSALSNSAQSPFNRVGFGFGYSPRYTAHQRQLKDVEFHYGDAFTAKQVKDLWMLRTQPKIVHGSVYFYGNVDVAGVWQKEMPSTVVPAVSNVYYMANIKSTEDILYLGSRTNSYKTIPSGGTTIEFTENLEIFGDVYFYGGQPD